MATVAAMATDEQGIVPDDKDWTWVLERPCPECGFDASTCDPRAVAGMIRENAAGWHARVDAGRVRPGRPAPNRWSSLEYACHVRDVFVLYDERLRRMLEEDDPLYANWDQDDTADEDRYDTQDPAIVVAALEAAAARLADRFDGVGDAAWERTGRRSDGASFTVDTFSRYLVHDPIHQPSADQNPMPVPVAGMARAGDGSRRAPARATIATSSARSAECRRR